MPVCSMHWYGGEFTFPATAGRIVAYVAEGVYGKEVLCTLRGAVPICRGLSDASQPLAKVDPHIA